MIPRYARADMTAIWDQANKYRIWFEIEAHAATKMAELGVIPKEAAETVWAKGKDATFDPERIAAVQKFYVDSGSVQPAVPVEDLYTNDFVQ